MNDANPASDLRAIFRDPPREHGFMPFWFWNDDLQDDELLRQLRELHAKGCGGFVLHPRTGLSRRVGYLTDEFFRLVELVVGEAARLGMKVVLYDEAGYPAGSARGQVVAHNPAWAAQAIFAVQHTVKGPAKGFWRPNPGRALDHQLEAVVAGQLTSGAALDPATLRTLTWDDHELVAYDFPAGEWLLCAVWSGPSGGTTRGVFVEEEDGHATAPPAADILRREVVDYFISITHDAYHARLKEHFGKTVVAMFTDEPSPRGRLASDAQRAALHAWTPGFLEHVQARWDDDVRRWLPALWLDCGPRTTAFRQAYRQAEQAALNVAFYQPIGEWCERHGIVLTGHCANSNEMGTLRYFQWPGQDLVWRMVEPSNGSALEGPDSVAAKSGSSAARLGRRRFNVNEVFGAYGWQLTLDEVKWLLDWLFIRGTNLIYPHAAFYSVRGRRAFESEPDVAFHNPWWPYFGRIGDYARRFCWVLTDSEQVGGIGILTDGDNMAWAAAGVLHRHQFDFIFIDGPGLAEAEVREGKLIAGTQQLRLLVVDAVGALSAESQARLTEFEAAGGSVLREWSTDTLAARCAEIAGREVTWHGTNAADLRAAHYRKGGVNFFLFVNEGERLIEGRARLAATGRIELWNAADGSVGAYPAEQSGPYAMSVALRIDRRESVIIAVNPNGERDAAAAAPMLPGEVVARIEGPWTVTREDGTPVDLPAPGDWAQQAGWETFAGMLCYHANFEVSAQQPAPQFIDLGRVGDIAEVRLNGRVIDVKMWAPYVIALSDACRTGANQLEVRITNSVANTYNGRQLPSGLIGPVVLRSGA